MKICQELKFKCITNIDKSQCRWVTIQYFWNSCTLRSFFLLPLLYFNLYITHTLSGPTSCRCSFHPMDKISSSCMYSFHLMDKIISSCGCSCTPWINEHHHASVWTPWINEHNQYALLYSYFISLLLRLTSSLMRNRYINLHITSLITLMRSYEIGTFTLVKDWYKDNHHIIGLLEHDMIGKCFPRINKFSYVITLLR